MARKSKSKRVKPNQRSGIRKWPVTMAENYLGLGINNLTIGASTGIIGTGSFAVNDALMNTGSPGHIVLGTDTYKRLGKHLVFTRLIVRLYVNQPAASRFRMIVGKNQNEGIPANLITNTALTGFVEGNDIMEAPFYGSTLGPFDNMISPSTDYTILHDKMYGTFGDLPMTSSNNTKQVAVELEIPLMLKRTYKGDGTVDMGSWFLYMSSTGNASAFGTIRLEFVNTWSFESLGRGLTSAIDAADSVLTRASKSPAVHMIARYLPSIFGM